MVRRMNWSGNWDVYLLYLDGGTSNIRTGPHQNLPLASRHFPGHFHHKLRQLGVCLIYFLLRD